MKLWLSHINRLKVIGYFDRFFHIDAPDMIFFTLQIIAVLFIRQACNNLNMIELETSVTYKNDDKNTQSSAKRHGST